MDYFKWEKFMPLFFKGELDNMSIDLFEGYINKALSVQEVDEDYGVIALNIGNLMGDPAFNFNKFMDILKDERGKVVFVLVIQVCP